MEAVVDDREGLGVAVAEVDTVDDGDRIPDRTVRKRGAFISFFSLALVIMVVVVAMVVLSCMRVFPSSSSSSPPPPPPLPFGEGSGPAGRMMVVVVGRKEEGGA